MLSGVICHSGSYNPWNQSSCIRYLKRVSISTASNTMSATASHKPTDIKDKIKDAIYASVLTHLVASDFGLNSFLMSLTVSLTIA